MKRLTTILVLALTITSVALAANVPPGGPAPKPLLGTWTTTLTDAAARKAPFQDMMPTTHSWVLVILNSGVAPTKYAIGLRPAGQNGSSDPFGVKGHLFYKQCLDDDFGLPRAGHDTFSWSVTNGTLRFRLVATGCRQKGTRNDQVILTNAAWRHGKG